MPRVSASSLQLMADVFLQYGRGSALGVLNAYYIGLNDLAEEANVVANIKERRLRMRWTDNTQRTSDTNWKSGGYKKSLIFS